MMLLYPFVLLAGVANAIPAGTNATLAKTLNAQFLAALLIVGTSALALAAVGLASGELSWPTTAKFGAMPCQGGAGSAVFSRPSC